MSRSLNKRACTAQPLFVGLTLLLLCEAAYLGHAFAFVPIVASFAKQETTASKIQSRLVCQEGGGYIASEPTAVLHQSVVETVRSAGALATWYAFLGADTTANAALNCPAEITSNNASSGESYGCYWRWNQGRWTEVKDNASLPFYIDNVGVTFFIGNTWRTPTSTAVSLYGQIGGFPYFFNTSAPTNKANRPGMLFAKHLLAVGNSDTASWSDNLDSGGYSYANYKYNSIVGVSVWDAAAQAASKPYFWAVCQAQAPSRATYEMRNTSSGLQEKWWVIYFVILFVVTFVIFLIVALCQDDEDMDEPPEDAPEWAQQETVMTKHTKSFVSTRSFHANDYDDEDDYEERHNRNKSSYNRKSNGDSRRDNTSSDASSNASSEEGHSRGGYRDNEGGYSDYEQQQFQQAPNTGGGTRHLGRQNGSTYNLQQPLPAQFSPNGYVDNTNMNQLQNPWM